MEKLIADTKVVTDLSDIYKTLDHLEKITKKTDGKVGEITGEVDEIKHWKELVSSAA